MPLRIQSYSPDTRHPIVGGVTAELNGQPIKELVSIEVKADIDDVVRAKMEVLVTRPLDIVLDSVHTTILFKPFPDWEITEEPLPNGGRRITSRLVKNS